MINSYEQWYLPHLFTKIHPSIGYGFLSFIINAICIRSSVMLKYENIKVDYKCKLLTQNRGNKKALKMKWDKEDIDIAILIGIYIECSRNFHVLRTSTIRPTIIFVFDWLKKHWWIYIIYQFSSILHIEYLKFKCVEYTHSFICVYHQFKQFFFIYLFIHTATR